MLSSFMNSIYSNNVGLFQKIIHLVTENKLSRIELRNILEVSDEWYGPNESSQAFIGYREKVSIHTRKDPTYINIIELLKIAQCLTSV